MSNVSPEKKGRTLYAWAGLLGLAAVGLAFLPFFSVIASNGERRFLNEALIIFGGSENFVLGGFTYYYDYSVNIYALVGLQLFLLGALSSFLGKRSPMNLIFSLVFYGGGFALVALMPLWMVTVNPGFTYDGAGLGYGYFLSLAAGFLAFVLAAFARHHLKVKKQKLHDTF